MKGIVDDRNQEWFREIMKMVRETPGSRKTVHDRIASEIEGGKPEKSSTGKGGRA